jgi:hypothetical protein
MMLRETDRICVAVTLFIRVMLCSNLGHDTDYIDWGIS